ncbi:hypothetical protein SK128_001828 [Halocaridina rubra]|uniref:Uncharacterized protein n=1 Tax=Halocaridina rubra TaxID=373956 RepID=A0AAN9ABG5_HALRR
MDYRMCRVSGRGGVHVAAVLIVLSLGLASCQDGSYHLDSRGVQVQQGLTPSQQLFDNHVAFSEEFKQRSREMATQYSIDQPVYNDPKPDYTWAYKVDAKSTGDMKSAREERRGDVVVGQYSVMDPDGTLRTVDYTVAPGTGFQATVHKEENAEGLRTQYSRQNQYNQNQYQQYSRKQNQYQESDWNRFQKQQEYGSRYNQYQNQQYQNQQSYQRDFQDQRRYGNQFQNQDRNRNQYQRNYNNQYQNQQNYRQSQQYQNTVSGSGVTLKNYDNSKRYGFSRNDYNNDQYFNQGSNLYSRNENLFQQNNQRYGTTNKIRNQNQINYDTTTYDQIWNNNKYDRQQYSRQSDDYTQNQYNRDPTYNTRYQFNRDRSYINQQQNRYESKNYNVVRREETRNNRIKYNDQYDNQYNANQRYQYSANQRYQYNQKKQFQTSRFSQNNWDRDNQWNQRSNQYYNRYSLLDKNQNRYSDNYSPVSVVLYENA